MKKLMMLLVLFILVCSCASNSIMKATPEKPMSKMIRVYGIPDWWEIAGDPLMPDQKRIRLKALWCWDRLLESQENHIIAAKREIVYNPSADSYRIVDNGYGPTAVATAKLYSPIIDLLWHIANGGKRTEKYNRDYVCKYLWRLSGIDMTHVIDMKSKNPINSYEFNLRCRNKYDLTAKVILDWWVYHSN